MLLIYILTHLTGGTYGSYLQKHVLNGLDVELYSTAANKHTSDAIVQEIKHRGRFDLHPGSYINFSCVYSGDGVSTGELIGAFGLKASVATVASFLGTRAVKGMGARKALKSHHSVMEGARVVALSMNQIDCVDLGQKGKREYSGVYMVVAGAMGYLGISGSPG